MHFLVQSPLTKSTSVKAMVTTSRSLFFIVDSPKTVVKCFICPKYPKGVHWKSLSIEYWNFISDGFSWLWRCFIGFSVPTCFLFVSQTGFIGDESVTYSRLLFILDECCWCFCNTSRIQLRFSPEPGLQKPSFQFGPAKSFFSKNYLVFPDFEFSELLNI